MALERWKLGHPVCLLFILRWSLLSSPLLLPSLEVPGCSAGSCFCLRMMANRDVGQDAGVGSTQRRCHLLLSRVFSPSQACRLPGFLGGPSLPFSPLSPRAPIPGFAWVPASRACLGGQLPPYHTGTALSASRPSQRRLLSSLWWQVFSL